jgi:hypothetical protein
MQERAIIHGFRCHDCSTSVKQFHMHAGISTLLLVIPAQAKLAGKIAGLRASTAARTDERVRITGAFLLLFEYRLCLFVFPEAVVIIACVIINSKFSSFHCSCSKPCWSVIIAFTTCL